MTIIGVLIAIDDSTVQTPHPTFKRETVLTLLAFEVKEKCQFILKNGHIFGQYSALVLTDYIHFKRKVLVIAKYWKLASCFSQ